MICSKFTTIIMDNKRYVNANHIINVYKNIPGKLNASQKVLDKDLKLKNDIVRYRFTKYNIKIDFISKLLDYLKPKTEEDIFLEVNELENPTEKSDMKGNHTKLLNLIRLLPDIGTNMESDENDDIIKM